MLTVEMLTAAAAAVAATAVAAGAVEMQKRSALASIPAHAAFAALATASDLAGGLLVSSVGGCSIEQIV